MDKAQLDLAAIREREEKAGRMIGELCAGRRRWLMSIPAQENYDPDLVIAAAMSDVLPLAAEVERLQSAIPADKLHLFYELKNEQTHRRQQFDRANRLAAELDTIKAELPDLICVQLAYPRTCEPEPGTANKICAGCVLRTGPTQELNCVRTRRELYAWAARLREAGR